MHPLLRCELIERFLPFHGLQGDSGLFLATVAFSVNRHLFPLPDVPRCCFILSYLPVLPSQSACLVEHGVQKVTLILLQSNLLFIKFALVGSIYDAHRKAENEDEDE